MGLVATWLKGIGLGQAVPTFQAAGIVTPAALAELDVAHFEALGISDADDRRKLFYLVQRIKMAVNKDKQENSVEAQVDAVLSGTMNMTESVEEEKKQSHDDTSNETASPPDAITAPAPTPTLTVNTDEPVRRSKRLAAKQQSGSRNIAKENATVNGSSVKKNSPTSLFANKTKKTEREAAIGEKSPKKNAGLSKPTSRVKANTVFNLDDEDISKPTTTTTKIERKSGLKQPNYVSASSSHSDNDSAGESNESDGMQTPSKVTAPQPRRPESKLQNPGKSIRTGKQLSTIPSEEAAPMSPLVDFPPSQMEEATTRGRKSRTSKRLLGTRRRDSNDEDSLDELLQSSASEFDSESESGGGGSDSENPTYIPTLSRQRSKSVGSADVARTQGTSLQAPSSSKIARHVRRKSKTKDLDTSMDSSSKRTLLQQRSDSSIKSSEPSMNASFTHGGTESESFATKIAYLREDNQAEHELFCDDADKQLYNYDMRIRVIVRKRPLSKSEATLSGGVDVIHPLDYGDYGRILVYQPKTRVDLTKEVETIPFSYDNIFGEDSTNLQIYQRSLRGLIKPFFQGQWATVFAYGQTGSGKTYTMMGSNMTGINAGTASDDEANLGLYYLAALDIFDMVKRDEYKHLSVQVSLFEIYGGKLFDLLNKRRQIKCLEDSRGKVCFPGLTEHATDGPNRLMELIEEGALNRSTGTTSRNADSSRSHAVLQLKLRKDVGRRKNVEHGRLNFIDLAGSERGADTSSCSRATRLEGAEINTSLLALKEVIRALATGGSMTHIPFRGSKLTQVLKDSFVGENSRCCMIACISPDIKNCEQTLNTLRYADRVKERNAETGAVASSYEQPVRLGPIDLTSQHLFQESSNDDGEEDFEDHYQELGNEPTGTDENEDEHSMSKSVQSDADTAVLDDLLASSLNDQSRVNLSGIILTSDTSKHKAGEALVSAHRSVMSSMLAMVKNEMAMVNRVDADRDKLDEYLGELEMMQSTQLDLISKLRGALDRYVGAVEDDPEVINATRIESDDESFEDLRD